MKNVASISVDQSPQSGVIGVKAMDVQNLAGTAVSVF